jgi:hypothetical protein
LSLVFLEEFHSERVMMIDVMPGYVFESDTDVPDPEINKRMVRVVFADEAHDYQTSINGTRASIADYFRGALLNIGNDMEEVMESPTRLEFLNIDPTTGLEVDEDDYDEDGVKVIVDLNKVVAPVKRVSVSKTIGLLKAADEDYEWYPTTDAIIRTVAENINSISYHDRPKSILDVGAGDGRVLTAIDDMLKGERHNVVSLYAIEKATTHISAMPKRISVIGTDFLQQTLVDKPVGVVFCNPPYSEYENFIESLSRIR